MNIDVLTAMKQSKMTFFQIRTVALCMAALLLVGYDLTSIAMALPYVPEGFFESDTQRGLVLSAALLGMTLGCFFIAPIADKIGRRKLIVAMLFLGAIGMLACATVDNAYLLFAARLVTGIASGSMIACLFILVQEQASDQRRATVFGIFTIGFAGGALLSGGTAMLLLPLPGFEWQYMYFIGFAATLTVAILALIALPESVEFLIAREAHDPKTQVKLDRLIARLKNPAIDPLARPAVSTDPAPEGGIRLLFANRMYIVTFLLWIALIGPSLTYFFVSTWTPSLVTLATGELSVGTTIGLFLSVGTVLGSIALAILAVKISPFLFIWVAGFLGAAAVVGLSLSFSNLAVATFATVAVGMLCGICQAGTGALVPALYPVSIRTTANGWLQGLGFLAGFIAPLAAGALLSIVAPESLFALSGIAMAVGASAACVLWVVNRKRTRAQDELTLIKTVTRDEPLDDVAHTITPRSGHAHAAAELDIEVEVTDARQ